VFISTGKGAFAQDFVEKMQLTSPVWVDPKLESYKLLGFARNKFTVLLDPRAALNAARALSKGFTQGRTAGDTNQHGGVVVVRKGGEVVYSFASEVAGDLAPLDAVLESAHQAARP
jgi:AhpC/TSA antioxidant enzyme